MKNGQDIFILPVFIKVILKIRNFQKSLLKQKKRDCLFETVSFLSLLSDSNQRPRDYKSRALAN